MSWGYSYSTGQYVQCDSNGYAYDGSGLCHSISK